ncbi:MAG: GntR family transcriptional regulator, partial [Pseudolabrys sp.]|nr:GntR family transcriptional regulator [Pseudolabrys sp.]
MVSKARKNPAAAGRLEVASLAKSVASLIAGKVEEDVVLGRRHPRERLVEQELGTRFRTHRADVRLALFELEKRGIVQRIPN